MGGLGLARWDNIGLAALIILNVLAMMLETVDQLYRDWRIYFIVFEIFSIAVFLVEYLLRVWISELTQIGRAHV